MLVDLSFSPESLRSLRTALAGPSESAGVVLDALLKEARSKAAIAQRSEPGWWDALCECAMSQPILSGAAQRAELLLLCCQIFLKEGRLGPGVVAAERAVAISSEHHELPLLRRAHTILGALHSRGRRMDQAIVQYARAHEIAEDLDEVLGRCSTISNLAGALWRVGLYEESMLLSRYAIDIAGEDPALKHLKVQAHQHIALVAQRKRDLATAREHAELALSYCDAPATQEAAYVRVLLEHTLISILAASGDAPAATTRLGEARAFAVQANSKQAEAQLATAQCLVDTHAGRNDISLTRLSLLLSKPHTNQALHDDELEAAMLSHRRAGDHRSARRYHRELLARQCELRRDAAVQQIMAVKAVCNPGGDVTGWLRSLVPDQTAEQIADEGSEYWRGFREQLETIAIVGQLRDDPSGEHAFRIGRLTGLLASRLGFSPEEAHRLELAARLRDIGKVVIPDSILLSRDQLTAEEREVIRTHAVEGARILLEASNAPHVRLAAEIALGHHEWWDGSGYPHGNSGEAIPISARIVALADVFDAITHARPYKKAWPFDFAVRTIREQSGRQFDPRLCEAFVGLVQDLRDRHGGRMHAVLGEDAGRLPFLTANRIVEQLVRYVREREARALRAC